MREKRIQVPFTTEQLKGGARIAASSNAASCRVRIPFPLVALRRAGVIGGHAGLHSALETRHSLAELLPYNGRQQSYQR
jgi:hypothetical protein